MIDDSIKLAKLWNQFFNLKEQLDNEILPVAGYLGIEDPELMIALETLSAKIESHFEKFMIIVTVSIM